MKIQVVITPNDRQSPVGKLADVELHFGEDTGVLAGLRLIGFAVWARRTGGGLNVTFPARQYSVNGEKRSFALLRPAAGDSYAQDRVRDFILQAFEEWQARQGEAGEAGK